MNAPCLKNDNSQFNDLRTMFGKTLSVNKFLSTGHVITINDLESKKPAHKGIPASDYQQVIGKELKKDKQQWDFLTEDDVN
jgi:N-acetylneuraminate synthase